MARFLARKRDLYECWRILLLLIVVVGLSFVVYIVTKRHETAVALVDAELAFSVADAAADDAAAAAAVVATAELLAYV